MKENANAGVGIGSIDWRDGIDNCIKSRPQKCDRMSVAFQSHIIGGIRLKLYRDKISGGFQALGHVGIKIAGCGERKRPAGAGGTCSAGWASRGDVKRKVAINPQTMGNYKKIKSITLRMEPSGTTWAAFLRGQAGKEEIY